MTINPGCLCSFGAPLNSNSPKSHRSRENKLQLFTHQNCIPQRNEEPGPKCHSVNHPATTREWLQWVKNSDQIMEWRREQGLKQSNQPGWGWSPEDSFSLCHLQMCFFRVDMQSWFTLNFHGEGSRASLTLGPISYWSMLSIQIYGMNCSFSENRKQSWPPTKRCSQHGKDRSPLGFREITPDSCWPNTASQLSLRGGLLWTDTGAEPHWPCPGLAQGQVGWTSRGLLLEGIGMSEKKGTLKGHLVTRTTPLL